MPALPGTFDGSRYKDLRNLLPKSIQDYYKKSGEWDAIVRLRFYENSDVVWFKRTRNGRTIYVKHKWGYRDGPALRNMNTRFIEADDYSETLPR